MQRESETLELYNKGQIGIRDNLMQDCQSINIEANKSLIVDVAEQEEVDALQVADGKTRAAFSASDSVSVHQGRRHVAHKVPCVSNGPQPHKVRPTCRHRCRNQLAATAAEPPFGLLFERRRRHRRREVRIVMRRTLRGRPGRATAFSSDRHQTIDIIATTTHRRPPDETDNALCPTDFTTPLRPVPAPCLAP